MENLPADLMLRICESLCRHCQSPDTFPHAEIWAIREDKGALASLAATCSWCRAFAQPVLFHYFATGNLVPRNPRQRDGINSHPRDFPARNGVLPLFIRSAIQRPDLAAKVKALQLVQSLQLSDRPDEYVNHIRPWRQLIRSGERNLISADEIDTCADSVRAILEKAYRGASTHEDADSWKAEIRQWLDGTAGPGRDWLIQLALLLVPNLERLGVARDSHSGPILELGNATLRSLKSLALQPWQDHFHIEEAGALFAAAPNLEVLYAFGCGGKDEFYYDPAPPFVPFKLNLGNLQKLVVNGIEFFDLAMLLPACPQLQELQYDRPQEELVVLDTIPLDALMPIQKTLRALRIRFTKFSVFRESPRARPRKVSTFESFRHFVALEDLMIEHAAVDCPPSPTLRGRQLVDWLPPSIERVHFREVPDDQVLPFLDHLSVLALEAPNALPRLRSVRLTPRDGFIPWEDADLWHRNTNDCWQLPLHRVVAELGRAGVALDVHGDPVREREQEPWLDNIHPDLADKARRFGLDSF